MSRRPRHVGPSERRTAGRARDETDGRLQPIPKVDWIAVQFARGVPTVADRIAQMVVKRHLEPLVEPQFHPDSYGYRPDKSALDAVDRARQRCWRLDWVL